MKTFFKSLKISFSISATFLGVGFLSGKEYFVYLINENLYLFLLATFLINCLLIVFLLTANIKENLKVFDYLSPIIYFADFVVLCGCLSAADSLFAYYFPKASKLPIVSSIIVIFINVVLSKGIKGVKAVSAFIVPSVIVFILFFVFLPSKKIVVLNENFSIKNPILLCGFNLLLALPMISTLGKREKFSTCIVVAIISSLIILIMTFVISVSLMNLPQTETYDDFPLIKIFDNNLIFIFLYFVIINFGIFTSSSNAYYPIHDLLSKVKAGRWLKIAFSIVAIVVSRLGFSNIVSKIYPLIGLVGFSMIIIFAFELFFFQKERPKNTLKRQVRIK